MVIRIARFEPDAAVTVVFGFIGRIVAQQVLPTEFRGNLLARDDQNNALYLPLSLDHHTAANGELLPFVEKRVRVTGKVIEKDGIKAIVLEQVRPPSKLTGQKRTCRLSEGSQT